jgi:CBS-domain-containing membrane protein
MRPDWLRAATDAIRRNDHRNILAGAAAVGLAIVAMYVTGTFHPPAGINPLLVISNNLPWSFLMAPVLAGAVLLTALAYVWHRWIRRRPWPQRWL